MTKLVMTSGVIIYEEDRKVYIMKGPSSWINVFMFVTGLIAILFSVNGVAYTFAGFKNHSETPWPAIIMLGIGIVFVIINRIARARKKRIQSSPFEKLKIIVVFDFANNNLLDAQQQIIAPLSQVYIRRKMQLTSSSPEIMLEWGHGSMSLVKGNPFSGGVLPIEKVLVLRGVRKK